MSDNDNGYLRLNKKAVIYTLAALGLVLASATAASYATREHIESAQTDTPKPSQAA